mmetsp:Transcript_22448/g.56729  ORF Transcript_22448/g.56729 Transcript_22448/m.56729 type:complete len:301 (+) Transcript_22448:947-1849(+)
MKRTLPSSSRTSLNRVSRALDFRQYLFPALRQVAVFFRQFLQEFRLHPGVVRVEVVRDLVVGQVSPQEGRQLRTVRELEHVLHALPDDHFFRDHGVEKPLQHRPRRLEPEGGAHDQDARAGLRVVVGVHPRQQLHHVAAHLAVREPQRPPLQVQKHRVLVDGLLLLFTHRQILQLARVLLLEVQHPLELLHVEELGHLGFIDLSQLLHVDRASVVVHARPTLHVGVAQRRLQVRGHNALPLVAHDLHGDVDVFFTIPFTFFPYGRVHLADADQLLLRRHVLSLDEGTSRGHRLGEGLLPD